MTQAPQAQTPGFTVDITPYRDAIIKRRAQFSTVIVFKTSDPKRLEPFIRYVKTLYGNLSRQARPIRIFVYKVWGGLYQVTFRDNEEIEYTPVRAVVGSIQQSPLAQLAVGGQRIRSLEAALAYLDQMMENEYNVVAIFWGLFAYGQVSQQEMYAFIKFLRNAIFDDRYYARGHMIVVFTDSPETIIDEDTLRHCILINIPPSTDNERKAMLRAIAAELGVQLTNGELEALSEATRGLTLHDVESVALESFYRYRKFDVRAMTAFKYDLVRKTGILDIEEPQHGFEAVGGYDAIKEFIKVNVVKVLRNPKKAEGLGLRPPRGILLFGPPGTGKTWFAKALAKELGLPFLRLRTEKIVSKWYGETSRNLAKALEVAEAVAPAVLFIDEIDRFGRRGHLTEHEESRRAFSILLEWLGDARRKTIVIGTTNRPEDLDEAFRRVGRFDYIIPMLYPDFKARLEILKVHTSVVRKVPLAEDVDLAAIAERTEYWSGAELEELVLRAARRALKEDAEVVEMRHFQQALSTFRINQEERRRQLEHYLKLAEEFTNDAEFLELLRSSYGREKSRVELLKEELGLN